MRLRHPSGRIVHFGCAITPRPALTLPVLIRQLDTYASARARLGADRLGIQLWLPPALAAALAVEGRTRTRLRAELDARRLEVVTLSGAPFDVAEGGGPASGDHPGSGTEGGEPAGDLPGWNDPARREYTLDLARVLVDLLPDETVRGALHTTGLAPRAGWNEQEEKATAGILRRLSAGLADLAWQNGRAVRVGFQPAPGLVLDTAEGTAAGLSRTDKDRLGVALDLTHAVSTWADPVGGIGTLHSAGVSIVEIRLTATPGPDLTAWRAVLHALLGPQGPQADYLTLVSPLVDPSPEQIVSDMAYVLAELATLGVVPENEPCPAH